MKRLPHLNVNVDAFRLAGAEEQGLHSVMGGDARNGV
jgi:hypothetical protein